MDVAYSLADESSLLLSATTAILETVAAGVRLDTQVEEFAITLAQDAIIDVRIVAARLFARLCGAGGSPCW